MCKRFAENIFKKNLWSALVQLILLFYVRMKRAICTERKRRFIKERMENIVVGLGDDDDVCTNKRASSDASLYLAKLFGRFSIFHSWNLACVRSFCFLLLHLLHEWMLNVNSSTIFLLLTRVLTYLVLSFLLKPWTAGKNMKIVHLVYLG